MNYTIINLLIGESVGFKNITTETNSFDNLQNVSYFNNCSYAFVAKTGWYKSDEADFPNLPFNETPVVFDWYYYNMSALL